MADSDPLAEELAAIRAEGYLDGPVPRLLKAVEAVLAMTAGTGEPDLDWDGNPEHFMIRVIRCDEIRQVITRELTREETSE